MKNEYSNNILFNGPSLTDLIFKALFPNVNAEKASKMIKETAEELEIDLLNITKEELKILNTTLEKKGFREIINLEITK